LKKAPARSNARSGRRGRKRDGSSFKRKKSNAWREKIDVKRGGGNDWGILRRKKNAG